MKITELIKELTELYVQEGDLLCFDADFERLEFVALRGRVKRQDLPEVFVVID